ncbi:MAG: GntR family transcriptional regulator [Sinobacteraceae bacterium]|nr:GntR family transcriptional regulator [Nevskiaceae bacterium]MBV9913806.1 GntR family transcriptional regulator [Nevskiaceae bacterium]
MQSLTRQTNTQQTRALLGIREMILQGKLRAGQRVAEAPVAGQLGMSRTPVRQALPVLAEEGLLVEHQARGYVVRAVSRADICDAIDLRGLAEGLAARRVAERGAPAVLCAELHACLEMGDGILSKGYVDESDQARYAEMNARFHDLIVHAARSPMIEQSLERLARVPFVAPHALAFDPTSLERMYAMLVYAHRQHHYIVVALERGESARAEALMREHAYPVKDSLNIGAKNGKMRGTRAKLALVGKGSG